MPASKPAYKYYTGLQVNPSSPKRGAKLITIDWRAVGRRVRQLRGFDMTQQEFADRIGISQTYLSDVEHGKFEVGAEIVIRIAREFGRSMEWLLTGEDVPPVSHS